ncbi:MAG TPA: hypothetical protein DCO80_01970 [Ornithinibacillus sp.]|nr:hypothetical protein [Ornithinibacillus sp.]
MYYVSLKSINQEKNLQIPLNKLKIVDEYLNYLFPNQTISPKFIGRKSNVDNKTITKLLLELSFRGLIGVRFIIKCTNDDPDLVHAFEFNSDDELTNFIRNQNNICSECGSTLDTKNIRVAFIIKDFNKVTGENYG